MLRHPRRLALLLLLLPGLACAGQVGGALIDGVFSAIKKNFLGVAASNYGETYRDDFDKVLSALTSVAKEKVTAVNKDGTAAVPGQPVPAPAGTVPAPDGTTPVAPGTTPVPAGTPGAPVAGVPGAVTPFPGVAPMPGAPAVSGALELEFVLLKEEVIDGRSVPTPVTDGDVLYDGFGTHGVGDNLKLRFRAGSECWVYVIGVDSTGWAKPLFPSAYAAQTNPVKANSTVELPPGDIWVSLDSWRGAEHVFVLASRTPRADLEKALAELAANVRDVDPARVLEAKEKVELVAQASTVSRGWGEVRKSEFTNVQNSQGQPFSVDTQVYSAKTAGELVLTRWFRHQ